MANIINCLLYYYKLFKRWQWSSCRNKFKVITLTCFFYSFCRNKSQAITKVRKQKNLQLFPFKATLIQNAIIPSFRLRDNSVNLHECSPFWVVIFIFCLWRKQPCLLFDVDMCILIGKSTEAFSYVIENPNTSIM